MYIIYPAIHLELLILRESGSGQNLCYTLQHIRKVGRLRNLYIHEYGIS